MLKASPALMMSVTVSWTRLPQKKMSSCAERLLAPANDPLLKALRGSFTYQKELTLPAARRPMKY